MKKIDNYQGRNELVSYEYFSSEIDKISKSDKQIDNISDKFSNIPQIIKSLTNFDPTGISSYLSELLESNKANRESEAIKKAMYIVDPIVKTCINLFLV